MPEPLRPSLTEGGRAAVRHTKDLRTFHLNPRVGDVRAIAESLDRNGQYKPIVVNRGSKTGRPDEVLAGNHTLLGARSLGWPTIQTWEVDVDDVAAARIVAADNRTADLGTYDEASLVELLSSVAADPAGLEGTGYSDVDLLELLNEGSAGGDRIDYSEEWAAAGMPDYETEDKRGVFRSWVHFRSEDDVEEFFRILGRKKAVSWWFPEDDGHVGLLSAGTRARVVAGISDAADEASEDAEPDA